MISFDAPPVQKPVCHREEMLVNPRVGPLFEALLYKETLYICHQNTDSKNAPSRPAFQRPSVCRFAPLGRRPGPDGAGCGGAGANCGGNAGGNGEDTTPPAVPSGLEADASDGAVDLSWSAADEADTYNVHRSKTSTDGASGSPLDTGLSDPSYEDTEVSNGTTYYYRVTTVNPECHVSEAKTDSSVSLLQLQTHNNG